MKLLSKSIRKKAVYGLGLVVTSCALLTTAWATSVDIAEQPFTSEGGGAKPNVMLLMDTSDSMALSYMPDEWEKSRARATGDPSAPGVMLNRPFPPSFMDAQCNPVYYNPKITYAVPKKADGTPYDTPSFTNAPYDGYGVSRPGVMVDLSTHFQAYDGFNRISGEFYEHQAWVDDEQAAYWHVYDGVVPPNTLPYKTPCNEVAPLKWKRGTPQSSAERTNFAIWYSYYRTRINMVRSAVSLAFHALDEDKYRIGFITVLPMDPILTAAQAAAENAGKPPEDHIPENYKPKDNAEVLPEKYLAIDDFVGVHKKQWFEKIFSQKPEGGSPTREGLARVGRHYAGVSNLINNGMREDPVIDYCQANFTILTTDGYWNAQNEASAGGPVGLDGKTRVETTDSDNISEFKKYSKPPMYDGGAIAKVTSQYEHVQTLFEPVECALDYVVTRPATWTKTTQQQYRNERHTVQRITSPQVVKSQTQKSTSQYLATRSQTLVVHGYPESWQVSKTNHDYSYTRTYVVKTRKESTTIRPGTQAYKYKKTAKAATGDLKRPWQQELRVAREVRAYYLIVPGSEKDYPNVPASACGQNFTGCSRPDILESAVNVNPDKCIPGDTGAGTVKDPYKRTFCTPLPSSPVPKPLGHVCATSTDDVKYVCDVDQKPGVTLNTGLTACPANLPASYGYSYDGKTGWFLTACTPGATIDSDICVGDVSSTCTTTKLDGQWEAWPNPNVACVRTPATELNGWVAKECEPQADAVKVVDFDFAPCGINSAQPGAPYNSCETISEPGVYVPAGTCTSGTSLVVDGGVKKQYSCTVYPGGPYAHNSSVCDASGNVKTPPSASNSWLTYSCHPRYFPNWASVTAAECSTYPKIVNEESFTCAHIPESTETYTRQCKNASNQVIPCVVESAANLYVDKPVYSCPAPQAATDKNNWVSVSCRTVTTGPAPSSKTACKATTTGAAPDYIRVTCSDVKLPPEDAATCQEKTAAAGDDYDVTCQANPVPNHVSMEFGTCQVPANNGDGIHAPKTECIGNTPKLVFEDWGAPCTNVTGDATNDYFGVECSTPAQATEVETQLDKASCVPQLGKAPDYKYITCTPEAIITEVLPSCPAGTNLGVDCIANLGQKWKFKQTYKKVTAGVSGEETVVTTGKYASAPDNNYYWVKQGGVDYGQCQSTTNPPVKITPFVPPKDVNAFAKVTGCVDAPSWPCSDTATSGGGGFSYNSLADVAQYYYATDLRLDKIDAVPGNGNGLEDDNARHQHMTTFVLGLGVSGTLPFDPDYKKPGSTGIFANIRNGTQAWPIWPVQQSYPSTPTNNQTYKWEDPRSIDDFWHTAVNGRGQFFSAKDPNSVVEGLQTTFAGIDSIGGAGSAETIVSPYLKAGSNISFATSYTNKQWTGEILAATVDVSTLELKPIDGWSVTTKLNDMVGDGCDDRNIFVFDNGTTTNLSQFGKPARCSAGVPSLSVSGNFDASSYFGVTQVNNLSQTSGNSATDATGEKFVNYIRGQKQYAGAINWSGKKYYRNRNSALGDIIHSQPVYVAQPNFSYLDAGYTSFKSNNFGRQPMLYVGANDGMLHAFYASIDVGSNTKAAKEAWAYIPKAVMGKLHRLADKSYAQNHTYFVNATPVVADISVGNVWKTILVGGLAGGGKGYFALDITNPEEPKGLWEFNPDNGMGYSFGQPLITKVKGVWKVILTSGYNNGSNDASSNTSTVYVLDPITGSSESVTFIGSEGLREVTAFVKNIGRSNEAEHLYAGDLSGNVWRVDTDLISTKIAELKRGGIAQPITTPVIATKMKDELHVAVGTGKLLGISDMGDNLVQSVYGFKDDLTAEPVLDKRTGSKVLELATGADGKRTLDCASNCSVDAAWYIDLDAGERVDLPMAMVASTLVFISNQPKEKTAGAQAMCSAGGQSYINFVDFVKGGAVDVDDSGNLYAGEKIGDRLTVGGTIVITDKSDVYDKLTLDDGTVVNIKVPVKLPKAQGKRVSWKEIIQ